MTIFPAIAHGSVIARVAFHLCLPDSIVPSVRSRAARRRCYRNENGFLFLRRLAPILVALLFGGVASAADATRQVWLVSTRDASHCRAADDADNAIHYWRMSDDCGWISANAQDFHDEATTLPTIVFIHGNRTDADEAVSMGMYVHETIRSQTADRPFRFVIWSWPADRVSRRIRPDAQLKASYSDSESYYLASWLAGLRAEVNVSLIGYSFGPRAIAGALQMLAGGDVDGQKLPDDTLRAWAAKKRKPIRAVLLAAADDLDSLAPDGRHGRALSQFEQVLITRNGCDKALRWYDRLYGRCGPVAMGLVGPAGIDGVDKVTVVDVSGTVGKSHDCRCYCSAICGQWARYTFLDDPPAKP
jgi:hypothetical protein